MDEFRFWKEARTSKEVGRNWWTQVHGGANTDESNTNLGVYFKFNEGITNEDGVDSVALDYSGRISNGQIVNYNSNMRQTGSAIVESKAAASEFKDPIIYSFHPNVSGLLTDKKDEGSVYDARNSSAIHTTLPNWMAEDDKEIGASNLVKIIQTMASYFDTLHLQLESLPRMKDAEYTKYTHLKAKDYADGGSILEPNEAMYPAYSSSFSGRPKTFIKSALESFGLDIPEIFTDASALEQLRSRDEDREYKDKLYNVKNQIYQNIYNNLNFILKSKGTEKSFRNLVRCFGVDDELVRLNLYGNNVDFELKNNFRTTAVKKTYVDFMDVDRQSSTVYMMTSSVNNNTNAYSYIPSNSTLVSGGFGMTFQTEINFPFKGKEGDAYYQPFTELTSSLFGVHTALEASAGSATQGNTKWNNPDVSEFKVYAVRPEKDSPHAYFQLTSSVLGISLETDVYDYVYDNEKWNFAVRIKPTKYPWANQLDGTNSTSLEPGVSVDESLSYEVSFYGAHADLDVIVDEFDLSATISATKGDNFMSGSKRVYLGAHRTNFSGSLLQESDVKISSTRAWMDFLTNEELRSHAKDAESKGVIHPYRNAFVFQGSSNIQPFEIPRSDLLIFEWDFTNVTSSAAGISGISTAYDARFIVEDISSGSTSQNYASWITDNRYGTIGDIVRNQYTGQGDFFEPNNTKVVDYIYAHSAKIDPPEVINSSDMIEILNQDDLEFTRDTRPIDYFYAVEKSMYQTISDEMLRMFATIKDFNNLIGEPVNRYRGHYKDMDKLKSMFFENIGNTPDLDKYVDFYKWIDASITKFLEQLFPASANFADELRTVVESHVLERSAYRNKFPTLEVKQQDPESPILGINELKYNWKFGHAPVDKIEVVAASGSIQINSTPDAAQVVSITSSDGTTKTYVFLEDGVDDTGTIDSGSVVVQLDGVSGVGNIAAELQTAINDTNGHNGGSANSVISISRADGILSLTQVVGGAAGNQTITWNGPAAQLTLVGFTGGLDSEQNINCLWYNQRAERTLPAITTGDAPTDNDREDILRIATTENTGSYLARHQGSTYVLRKLSRPYKGGVSFTKQIKGGVNFDHNKKVDYWKGLFWKGTGNNMSILPSTLSIDDSGMQDKDCIDGDDKNTLTLSKNKIKSYLNIDDNNDGASTSGANKLKSNFAHPFNMYTLSGTSEPEVGYDDVQYVNIHQDGYGTLAEVPMQGPFAEKYEGGNQHRHVRLNDGKDLDNHYNVINRPEAWNYVLNNSTIKRHSDVYTDGVDAPYYRDFIAKRPVVIKNILQTTASVDVRLSGTITHGPIGNYSHQHDIIQTSGRKINNKYFVEHQGVGFGKVFDGATHDLDAIQASPKVAFYNRVYNFATPERKTTNTVFVEKFSAPGSYEVMSRGFLDPFAEEMSSYNAMPFRNLTVRGDRFKKNGVTKAGVLYAASTTGTYAPTAAADRLSLVIYDQNLVGKLYFHVSTSFSGAPGGSTEVNGQVIPTVFVSLTADGAANFASELKKAIDSDEGHNGGTSNSSLGVSLLGNGQVGILGASSIAIVQGTGSMLITGPGPAQIEMSASNWSTSSLGSRSLLSRHTLFGGVDFEAQSDGAFHKTYRNRLRRIEQNGSAVTASVFDNAFITHMIPRSDFQYSWITASVVSTNMSNEFGFGYFPYSGEVFSSDGKSQSAVNFITQSSHASYIFSASNGFDNSSHNKVFYGINEHHFSEHTPGSASRRKFAFVDFVGINTNFVDDLDVDTNQITATNRNSAFVNGGYVSSNFNSGRAGFAAKLNGLNLRRNGPAGYASFKQIRQSLHPIARHLKNNNKYSISVLNGTETVISNLNNQIIFPKLNYRTKTDNSYDSLKGLTHQSLGAVLAVENYIEPPLTSKFKPMRHDVNVSDENKQVAPLLIDHTYTNNFDYFANPTLMNRMNSANAIVPPGQQVYDNLLEYTVKGTVPQASNPIKGFRSLVYKETIYPKEQHTYLGKTRGRTLYTEEPIDITKILGQQRTFWRDNAKTRQRSLVYGDTKNAFNNNEFPFPVPTPINYNIIDATAIPIGSLSPISA